MDAIYTIFDKTQVKGRFNNGNFDENEPDTLKSAPEDDSYILDSLDDFAEVGAMMLTEGIAGETEYLPEKRVPPLVVLLRYARGGSDPCGRSY